MLHCPSSKCQFVSECKHHFEYHLREYHFGPKPFKTQTALATLVDVASQQSKSEVEVANSISVTGPFKSPQPEEEGCLGLNGQPIAGCPFNPLNSVDYSHVPSLLPSKFCKTILIQIDLFVQLIEHPIFTNLEFQFPQCKVLQSGYNDLYWNFWVYFDINLKLSLKK